MFTKARGSRSLYERCRAIPRLLGATSARALLAAAVAVSAAPALAGSAAAAGSHSSTSFAAACGTKKVTLQGYFETGFPDVTDLTSAFTKQYPSVKWKIREDPFATITQDAPLTLGGPNPPDLMRLPTISSLVKDHLLKNLTPYYNEYHWNKFPASQLAQLRTSPSGVGVGSGPLYAMGLNYSLTGVFYNKALAAQVGMKAVPKTLAQLDALLAKAKAAGITPIEQFNGGATGGLLFPLQQLMADYGSAAQIDRWVFDKPGATIDTPANVAAATHLQQWIQKGYFNTDANAVLYPQMMSNFEAGKALLIFDGDWESGNFDQHMPGKVGFFLMPPLKAGGPVSAMSAPLTYGIAARAAHPACTAFFLNWVATNPTARKINVEFGGSNPGGPTNLPIPKVKPGSTTAQTLAAGGLVAKDNGDMGFIANANGSIYAEAWTPAVQKLFAGQETPQGVLGSVQAAYKADGS
jgi:raffinose/stachyose/melibiose transport system substrate-binding protein